MSDMYKFFTKLPLFAILLLSVADKSYATNSQDSEVAVSTEAYFENLKEDYSIKDTPALKIDRKVDLEFNLYRNGDVKGSFTIHNTSFYKTYEYYLKIKFKDYEKNIIKLIPHSSEEGSVTYNEEDKINEVRPTEDKNYKIGSREKKKQQNFAFAVPTSGNTKTLKVDMEAIECSIIVINEYVGDTYTAKIIGCIMNNKIAFIFTGIVLVGLIIWFAAYYRNKPKKQKKRKKVKN